jgi:uncharacterized repeat protein (TIGR02543 family)
MKTGKKNKWLAAWAALVIALAAASCAPVMETAGFDKAGTGTLTGTTLKLNPVDKSPLESARSIAVDPQYGLYNYFEVIAKKIDHRSGTGQAGQPIAGDRYYSVRGSGKRQAVSIPVEPDYRYDVLLLGGYMDSRGGDPVLLWTAFARTDWIHYGDNDAGIIYQQILVQPDDNTDSRAGMRVYLTNDELETGIRPDYPNAAGDQPLLLRLPRYEAGVSYLSDVKLTMAIDSITPLIMAKNGPDSTELSGVAFNDFFADGRLDREVLVHTDNWRAYPAWSGGAEGNVDSGGVSGRAVVQWNLGSAESFLPPVDGVTGLYFDLKYYGFSETPAPGTSTAAFTRWAIRNGLSNEQSDKQNSGGSIHQNTGGLITAVFGNGWSTDTWNPANGEQYLFGRPPVIRAAPANGGLSYTIVPSEPEAAAYTLYWRPALPNDAGYEWLTDADWQTIEIDPKVPGNMTGMLIPAGAANYTYALRVTAARDNYRDKSSAITICPITFYTVTFNSNGGTPAAAVDILGGGHVSAPSGVTRAGYTLDGWYKEPDFRTKWNFNTDTVMEDITLYARWSIIIDTTTYINVAGTTGSGLGWTYEGGVYTILNGSQIYRIYSSTGADLNRSIVVSENCTDVVLEMIDDPANADPAPKSIQLSGAPPCLLAWTAR